MRRILFAPTIVAARNYAEFQGWLHHSWKFPRDLADVVGLTPAGTEVVVLPGVERHPHHAAIARALEQRPVRITYVPAPAARMPA